MYKCDNCDKVFDYPKRTHESDRGQIYTVEVCPRCGWDGFDNVELCDRCGDPEVASKIENGFCVKCSSDILCQYAEFVSTLTEAERNFLETTIHDRL